MSLGLQFLDFLFNRTTVIAAGKHQHFVPGSRGHIAWSSTAEFHHKSTKMTVSAPVRVQSDPLQPLNESMALTCIKGIGHFLTIFWSGPVILRKSCQLILLQNIWHASELRERSKPVFAILYLTQEIWKALQFPISPDSLHKRAGVSQIWRGAWDQRISTCSDLVLPH